MECEDKCKSLYNTKQLLQVRSKQKINITHPIKSIRIAEHRNAPLIAGRVTVPMLEHIIRIRPVIVLPLEQEIQMAMTINEPRTGLAT